MPLQGGIKDIDNIDDGTNMTRSNEEVFKPRKLVARTSPQSVSRSNIEDKKRSRINSRPENLEKQKIRKSKQLQLEENNSDTESFEIPVNYQVTFKDESDSEKMLMILVESLEIINNTLENQNDSGKREDRIFRSKKAAVYNL